MATYRRARAEDAAAISSFWNRAAVQTAIRTIGYEVGPEDWSFALAHPRAVTFLAFDNANVLRGLVEFYVSRGEKPEGYLSRWALDPALSIANIRTHLGEALRALFRVVPNGFQVWVPSVPLGALRLREYLNTRMPFVDGESASVQGITRSYGPVTVDGLR